MPQIEKARFQEKLREHPAYRQTLSVVVDKPRRALTRGVLLAKMRRIYADGFLLNRHRVPAVSRQHQAEFRGRLLNDSPREVFPIFISRGGVDYVVYFLRTPATFAHDPDRIVRLVTVDDEIVDMRTLA